jgi:hypothetical protein
VLPIFQTGNTMVIVFVDTPQPITTDALAKALTLQILRDRRKLLQSRFQFFGDFQGEHVRIRQIRAVFERFVPKSENKDRFRGLTPTHTAMILKKFWGNRVLRMNEEKPFLPA